MFWKIGNKNSSITARLTFLYGILSCFLLLAVSLFSYWSMHNIVYKADQEFVTDEINKLEKILIKSPLDKSALQQQIIAIPQVLNDSIYRYYIRIVDEGGKILVETPEFRKILPQLDKNKYLIIQRLVSMNSQKVKIIIALDLAYQSTLVSKYRNSEYRNHIAILLFLGAILAIFLGYIIAKRGMQRLQELTKTVTTITVSSLHLRLQPSQWPRELIMLGESFNEMLDRIEISFSQLTQFSADLAHELRTPVNNLLGETEVALSGNLSLEKCQTLLESNIEELQRISQIIENLLFLSRAENPQFEIKKIPLNVAKEVNLVCSFYQPLADEKNIKITCHGDAILNANLIMFRRLFNNLLSNALNYSSAEGHVHFDIKSVEEKGVEVTLSDTGVGIPTEHLPKIFNRFYRVDTNRSQHSGGVGLGLAIAKSIVDLHLGKISISSKVGEGTTLILTFPT